MKTPAIDASIASNGVIEEDGTLAALALGQSETRVWVRFAKSRAAVPIGFVLPKQRAEFRSDLNNYKLSVVLEPTS